MFSANATSLLLVFQNCLQQIIFFQQNTYVRNPLNLLIFDNTNHIKSDKIKKNIKRLQSQREIGEIRIKYFTRKKNES